MHRPGPAAALLALAAALLLAAPAPSAATVTRAAYAWCADPSTPYNQPQKARFAWNSVAPTESASITRTAYGRYDVRFPRVGGGPFRGAVAASAYGPGYGDFCTVDDWTILATAVRVKVKCFDKAANLKDSRFTVMFTNADGRPPGWAHVLANLPTAAAPYSPPVQAGPPGPPATVRRIAQGRYNVTFPAIVNGVRGTAKVTAVRGGQSRCSLVGWGGSPLVVQVRCRYRINDGDSPFSLIWTERQPLSAFPMNHAYALAERPGSQASYPPLSAFQWRSQPAGTGNMVSRVGVGRYRFVHGLPVDQVRPGSPHVDAVGDEGRRCSIFGWGGAYVDVWCFAADGQPADSRFVVQYLT
ncbi:hypothetical protein DFJ74DRAFT_757334 [Hyaloraphidium curvatum]|nr:hypothetical protein DFJ74DRAFT_757334 [Hyaloraphidium curvatum]